MDEVTKKAHQVAQKLDLLGDVRRNIANGGKLYYSERQSKYQPATLYWVDNEPRYVEIVKEAEKIFKGKAFHAILTHTDFGDLLDVLVIPEDKALWGELDDNLKDGYFYSYCYNLSMGFGEGGYIRIKPAIGGLMRIE